MRNAMTMKTSKLMMVSGLLGCWITVTRAESEAPFVSLAGSWIVDAGPGQLKTVDTYTPIGERKMVAVESAINFDWTLNNLKPLATHGSTINGVVEKKNKSIGFTLITYALDAAEKAVYVIKATGNKVPLDKNTIRVENLVLHIYNDPESANPITDVADFSIPPSGTFPPIKQYRIQ